MKGQWIGEYGGSVDGTLMINIDDAGDHYGVVAYIHPSYDGIPGTIASFNTLHKGVKHELNINVFPIDPRDGSASEWEDIKHLFNDDVTHSKTAKVTIEFKDDELHISSISEIGILLTSSIKKPAENAGSKNNWRTQIMERIQRIYF